MNSKELLEKYPEAASAIVKHQTKVFNESLESSDISPEFKEFAKTQDLDYETVAAFMDVNPRIAFDTFDEHGLYITILPYPDGTFTYKMQSNIAEMGTTNTYKTRIEAERNAVEAAFPTLNSKLCQTV